MRFEKAVMLSLCAIILSILISNIILDKSILDISYFVMLVLSFIKLKKLA